MIFFFQAEDGIRDLVRSRGPGDVYKRQRLIAGFEQPTSGHIEIFGETAEGVPPYRRNVNTAVSYTHLTLPTSDLG